MSGRGVPAVKEVCSRGAVLRLRCLTKSKQTLKKWVLLTHFNIIQFGARHGQRRDARCIFLLSFHFAPHPCWLGTSTMSQLYISHTFEGSSAPFTTKYTVVGNLSFQFRLPTATMMNSLVPGMYNSTTSITTTSKSDWIKLGCAGKRKRRRVVVFFFSPFLPLSFPPFFYKVLLSWPKKSQGPLPF